jgi:hypothetical protein
MRPLHALAALAAARSLLPSRVQKASTLERRLHPFSNLFVLEVTRKETQRVRQRPVTLFDRLGISVEEEEEGKEEGR